MKSKNQDCMRYLFYIYSISIHEKIVKLKSYRALFDRVENKGSEAGFCEEFDRVCKGSSQISEFSLST